MMAYFMSALLLVEAVSGPMAAKRLEFFTSSLQA